MTIVGTSLNVFFTVLYAYAISRNSFRYRRFFTLMALFTMLFSAGTIPTYIVMTSFLNLKDTVAALILPMLLSPFNIMVMRSFFRKTISESIIESARIDGASEFRIFFQICLPLTLPGIATIALFTALAFGMTGTTLSSISRAITFSPPIPADENSSKHSISL